MYNGPSIYKNGGISDGDIINNIVFGTGVAVETISAAACEGSYIVTGANNAGSMTGTFVTVPVSFVLRRLGFFFLQGIGAAGLRVMVYDRTGKAVARTAKFTVSVLGEQFYPIAEIWNGEEWESKTEKILDGGLGYYLGLYCPQVSSGARFLGKDAGNNFGPKPWLSWTIDNIGLDAPAQIVGGYESSVRHLILGAS